MYLTVKQGSADLQSCYQLFLAKNVFWDIFERAVQLLFVTSRPPYCFQFRNRCQGKPKQHPSSCASPNQHECLLVGWRAAFCYFKFSTVKTEKAIAQPLFLYFLWPCSTESKNICVVLHHRQHSSLCKGRNYVPFCFRARDDLLATQLQHNTPVFIQHTPRNPLQKSGQK